MTELPRPRAGDCVPYFDRYISLVPEGPVIAFLEQQMQTTLELLNPLDDATAEQRYAPGKWSLKEVLGHIIDCERVFVDRALHLSRGLGEPLPGMDQDTYVACGEFDRRSVESLRQELQAVRQSSLHFFSSLTAPMLARRGTVNGDDMTVRAVPYIVAGHEIHHVQIIRERYLS